MFENIPQEIDSSWYVGHPYGSGFYNQDTKQCYVNIPKNASTTMKNICTEKNFIRVNWHTDDLDIKQWIIVWREPYSRFASGRNYMKKSGRINAVEHVAPQCAFVPQNIQNVLLISFDDLNKSLYENLGWVNKKVLNKFTGYENDDLIAIKEQIISKKMFEYDELIYKLLVSP